MVDIISHTYTEGQRLTFCSTIWKRLTPTGVYNFPLISLSGGFLPFHSYIHTHHHHTHIITHHTHHHTSHTSLHIITHHHTSSHIITIIHTSHTHHHHTRAVGAGAAGAAAAGPMFGAQKKKIIAAGCPTLAISPQDCTRNDLRRSKIQNFPGGACPQTRLLGALRALCTLRA